MFTCMFSLSLPSFLVFPFLIHRQTLRVLYTLEADILLFLGILGGRSLRASQKQRGLGSFLERELWGDTHPVTSIG